MAIILSTFQKSKMRGVAWDTFARRNGHDASSMGGPVYRRFNALWTALQVGGRREREAAREALGFQIIPTPAVTVAPPSVHVYAAVGGSARARGMLEPA